MVLNNWKQKVVEANKWVARAIDSNNVPQTQQYRSKAMQIYEEVLSQTDIVDYLLLDSNPIIPRKDILDMYFTLGTLYKNFAETQVQSKMEQLRKAQHNRTQNNISIGREESELFEKSIHHFHSMLKIDFENALANKQIISVFTQLCFLAQNNIELCFSYMQRALLFEPENEIIHYNLGHIYQRQNKLELGIIHFKISVQLCKLSKELESETDKLLINNYHGISSIYRHVKRWPEALHYSLKAEKIDPTDPDVQNQLGVVYTEMRRTDLAEKAYKKAAQHYKKAFISTDPTFLLSEIYLNTGHMHAYNGDNNDAIECYNKALNISPKFHLPFQNKLMNLSYIFDQLDDKQYIFQQHKKINKIYEKKPGLFRFDKKFFNSDKINIGIVSGDFVEHPVSFFLSTFLKSFDTNKFTMTCYSEMVLDTSLYNKNIKFKIIKNTNAETAAKIIHNDNIHILFDMAGHTAFNRLDVFALRPSPIQITYIGYPYTTGLNEMDYRITDNICDDKTISPTFYTEKLLYLPNCFLCYDPTVIKHASNYTFVTPVLESQPFETNNYITIACFNRVNKMTESVVALFNEILLHFPTVRFVFKTKGLLNKTVAERFLRKFDASTRNRITIIDCTITHEDHLLIYNKVDIAIDTFPYSGTTTSCEALYMGTPVFSIYDSKTFFHAQNVTCSILKNSDMEEYICQNVKELLNKIADIHQKPAEFWHTLKQDTRNKFMSGKVCNKALYMENLQNMLTELYNKHSITN